MIDEAKTRVMPGRHGFGWVDRLGLWLSATRPDIAWRVATPETVASSMALGLLILCSGVFAALAIVTGLLPIAGGGNEALCIGIAGGGGLLVGYCNRRIVEHAGEGGVTAEPVTDADPAAMRPFETPAAILMRLPWLQIARGLIIVVFSLLVGILLELQVLKSAVTEQMERDAAVSARDLSHSDPKLRDELRRRLQALRHLAVGQNPANGMDGSEGQAVVYWMLLFFVLVMSMPAIVMLFHRENEYRLYLRALRRMRESDYDLPPERKST